MYFSAKNAGGLLFSHKKSQRAPRKTFFMREKQKTCSVRYLPLHDHVFWENRERGLYIFFSGHLYATFAAVPFPPYRFSSYFFGKARSSWLSFVYP